MTNVDPKWVDNAFPKVGCMRFSGMERQGTLLLDMTNHSPVCFAWFEFFGGARHAAPWGVEGEERDSTGYAVASM